MSGPAEKRTRGGTVGRWAAGAFVLANLVAWLHARSMVRFATVGEPEPDRRAGLGDRLRFLLASARVARPVNDREPADLGLEASSYRIASRGHQLAVWELVAPEPAGAVAIFHGYAASRSQLLDLVPGFHALGWTAYLVDFPGSGGSTGSRTDLGYREAEDVSTIAHWIRDRSPDGPVLGYGFSMGGSALLRAAAELDAPFDLLVAEAVFDRMTQAVRRRFTLLGVPAFPWAELLLLWGSAEAGFNAFRHAPVRYARSIRQPTLVLQGLEDPRIRARESESIYHALAGPKAIRFAPGVGHEPFASIDEPAWRTVIERWLTSGLAAPGPTVG